MTNKREVKNNVEGTGASGRLVSVPLTVEPILSEAINSFDESARLLDLEGYSADAEFFREQAAQSRSILESVKEAENRSIFEKIKQGDIETIEDLYRKHLASVQHAVYNMFMFEPDSIRPQIAQAVESAFAYTVERIKNREDAPGDIHCDYSESFRVQWEKIAISVAIEANRKMSLGNYSFNEKSGGGATLRSMRPLDIDQDDKINSMYENSDFIEGLDSAKKFLGECRELIFEYLSRCLSRDTSLWHDPLCIAGDSSYTVVEIMGASGGKTARHYALDFDCRRHDVKCEHDLIALIRYMQASGHNMNDIARMISCLLEVEYTNQQDGDPEIFKRARDKIKSMNLADPIY